MIDLMDHLHSDAVDAVWAGGVKIGLGVVLTSLHLLHMSEELEESLLAVLFGGAFPFLLSLLIIGSGYWVLRRPWDGTSPWRSTGWCGIGIVLAVVLVGFLVGYQAAHGVRIADVGFVLAIHATYGAALGVLFARYDLRSIEARARVQRQNDRLEEFTSVVSHDLRNPLNVVQGRLELVREECDSPHLDDAVDAVDRSFTLIDDLLTLAREGEQVSDVEAVDLANMCDGCWKIVETGNATLVNKASQRIRADPGRLNQLLENLMRNAVDHGGDEVTVTIGDFDNGFYVADDGPGIPEENREQVFDPGYSTAEEGTGLGLNIVQEIAEAHGWEIRVTDSEAGGARFAITDVETTR